ncbi:phytoene/squalene synthase family protein [Sphingorhabdus soli]|uniref:Phytoene/squalene synthase family protein n=1 Tax=Flavisphingopyxis soli TaxID=2601267 RepID=A0A5C6UL46_9SPHN|nr:phytoene/squalene synthase family protein [Sphingorhabdus soli]TXC73707.1 phytoene/squalene synthase family protein [Sphingorhabdus soli]
MSPDTDPVLFSEVREVIAKGSKSFALASQLFSDPMRSHAHLLYAWARACDDLVDGQDMGGAMSHVPDPKDRVAEIRGQTHRAFAGQRVDALPFRAIAAVAANCRIPRAYADDVIEGFALDAQDWRPRSEADLLKYCYHVAGAIGCMMAIIMGVRPDDTDTLDRASDLGIAFQLANIARDIEEDAAADRCYLPLEWLVEMDIPPGEHMKPQYRDRLSVMAGWLAEYAEEYAASARIGAARLPFRARWAVLAATGIYGDIARAVRKRGDHAWDHRVTTSKLAKIGWVARAGYEAATPRALARDGMRDRSKLWTRPRH